MVHKAKTKGIEINPKRFVWPNEFGQNPTFRPWHFAKSTIYHISRGNFTDGDKYNLLTDVLFHRYSGQAELELAYDIGSWDASLQTKVLTGFGKFGTIGDAKYGKEVLFDNDQNLRVYMRPDPYAQINFAFMRSDPESLTGSLEFFRDCWREIRTEVNSDKRKPSSTTGRIGKAVPANFYRLASVPVGIL